MADHEWVFRTWQRALPRARPKSIVAWARENVHLVGSVLSDSFNPDITPWTRAPIEATDDNITRRGTFVKPVQCGGSEVGIIGILFRIATAAGGDIQYNWPSDKKAMEKWVKAIEKKIKACAPVMARVGELTWKKGLLVCPHLNLTVQGVHSEMSVASDSITFQVNEELHDETGGWFPGRLEQAHGRLTAVWNGTAFQISNAGRKGSELHDSFESGSKEYWEVGLCPGCRQFHRLRTRWDDKEPQLGGLRYDSEACKRSKYDYDYTRMLSSIRLQAPCGYEIREDARIRRALSLGGRYSPPTNPGAPPSHRSWTLEAVSVDYIPFLSLIQQKNKALKALAYGDAEPWWTYLRERECQFTSAEARPITEKIVLTDRRKDRAGLPNRIARFAAVDRQQGKEAAGELPHWWLLIVDAELLDSGVLHLLVVFEGKMLTDTDLVQTIKRHELKPSAVVVDSGWDRTHVYSLCLEHQWNALKGEGKTLFSHEDGSRRIYSVFTPLHAMFNRPAVYPYIYSKKLDKKVPDPREPRYWRYLKSGIMERTEWIRAEDAKHRAHASGVEDAIPGLVKLDIPADVSEDFLSHMASWEFTERKIPGSDEIVPALRQVRTRDDLYQCFGYVAMLCEMAELIGAGAADLPTDLDETAPGPTPADPTAP